MEGIFVANWNFARSGESIVRMAVDRLSLEGEGEGEDTSTKNSQRLRLNPSPQSSLLGKWRGGSSEKQAARFPYKFSWRFA